MDNHFFFSMEANMGRSRDPHKKKSNNIRLTAENQKKLDEFLNDNPSVKKTDLFNNLLELFFKNKGL